MLDQAKRKLWTHRFAKLNVARDIQVLVSLFKGDCGGWGFEILCPALEYRRIEEGCGHKTDARQVALATLAEFMTANGVGV